MADDVKALARRLFDEVINAHNLDLIDELVAPDVIEHEELPGAPGGREGVRAFFSMLLTAFPDVHFQIEDMIAEGDKVAARVTVSGTHQGTFMDIPATGKVVSVNVIDIFRVANGQVVEHWGLTDQMAMLQQLGVLPE